MRRIKNRMVRLTTRVETVSMQRELGLNGCVPGGIRGCVPGTPVLPLLHRVESLSLLWVRMRRTGGVGHGMSAV